ncbi:unnamed protein product [Brachionus calyciflorus]|uniref:Uncharacterized protein n=1 Tax=Brachionus calyciflorus TaxID=104777 RepID=A0A813XLY0_9BILA|nr:unnamed protein product [Brachionus calyciflorus]
MRKLSIGASKIIKKTARQAIAFFTIELFSVFILITIGILDIVYQNQTTSRASIALNQINLDISYSDKKTAARALITIYLIYHIYSLWQHNKYWLFIFFSNLAFLFFLSHEALTFKFITCFNYTNNHLVQARSILCIIFIVFLFLLNIISLRSENNFKLSTKNKTWQTLIFLLACVGFAAVVTFNVLILINLKPRLNFDISPKNIQLGFFTSDELAEIEFQNYTKTDNYETKIITSLDKILKSKSRSRLEICDEEEDACKLYDSIEYTVEILCNEKTKVLFKDCLYNEKLKIKIDYADVPEHPLPYFNCAGINGDECSKDGDCLIKENLLAMVQDNLSSDRVELGWSGLCNCEIEQPHIILKHNINIDPCS